MKVGADQADDLRRGKLIRSLIDDPSLLPPGSKPKDPNSAELKGKNASSTGAVLMIDANQVWGVNEAVEYVKGLEPIKPWYVLLRLLGPLFPDHFRQVHRGADGT